MAAAVLAALSIFVIPTFRDMFAGFGLQVSVFTKLVLTAAEWIASGRVLILAIVLIAVAVLLWQATRLLPVSVRNWFSDHFGLLFGRATAIARHREWLRGQPELIAAARARPAWSRISIRASAISS